MGLATESRLSSSVDAAPKALSCDRRRRALEVGVRADLSPLADLSANKAMHEGVGHAVSGWTKSKHQKRNEPLADRSPREDRSPRADRLPRFVGVISARLSSAGRFNDNGSLGLVNCVGAGASAGVHIGSWGDAAGATVGAAVAEGSVYVGTTAASSSSGALS